MALTKDTPRAFELGDRNDLPVKASTKIYEGAAVGLDSGYARGLVAGDAFQGFATKQADNSAVAVNGAINVRVKRKGLISLVVTGVTAVTDVGSTVYASADGTFTLSSTGNSSIGKIVRHVTGTTCIVAFEGVGDRSI